MDVIDELAELTVESLSRMSRENLEERDETRALLQSIKDLIGVISD